ncbi:hypothetical protein EON65_44400 [archaeon]|nr:MAG: hypothetical protein EON65_44400 [archaeon]
MLVNLSVEDRNALIESWVHTIHTYWQQHIIPVITHTSSYSIDIALIYNQESSVYTPFFIEINCFGKEYAAGSSLFHWLIDEDILYGKSEKNLVFRYAI